MPAARNIIDAVPSRGFKVEPIPTSRAGARDRSALPPATQNETAMSPSSDHYPMSMLIRRLESVAQISDEERQAILSLPAKVRVLDACQDIVRDGDKPSHCCLLLDGWAYRYKALNEGKRQILSFHIPGDIPDMMSLHLHTMDHSLASLTKVTKAYIPHESMLI